MIRYRKGLSFSVFFLAFILLIPAVCNARPKKGPRISPSKNTEKISESEAAVLLKQLKDDTLGIGIKIKAAKKLGSIKYVQAVEPLVNLLEKEDKKLADAAGKALAEIGYNAVLPVVDVLESSYDIELKMRCLNILGEINDPRAFEPIMAVYDEHYSQTDIELPDAPEYKSPNMRALKVENTKVKIRNGNTNTTETVSVQTVKVRDSYKRASKRAFSKYVDDYNDAFEELQENSQEAFMHAQIAHAALVALNNIVNASDIEKKRLAYIEKKKKEKEKKLSPEEIEMRKQEEAKRRHEKLVSSITNPSDCNNPFEEMLGIEPKKKPPFKNANKLERWWDKFGKKCLNQHEAKYQKNNPQTYSEKDIDELIKKKKWRSVCNIGRPAEVALIAAVKNNDKDIRCGAVKTLAKISDKSSLFAILPALKDKDEKVKMAAVEAVLKIGDGEVVKPLFPLLLKEKSKWVRLLVARKLGETNNKSAVKPLIISLKKDKDPSVKKQSGESLEKITGKNLGSSYKKWAKWWNMNKDNYSDKN